MFERTGWVTRRFGGENWIHVQPNWSKKSVAVLYTMQLRPKVVITVSAKSLCSSQRVIIVITLHERRGMCRVCGLLASCGVSRPRQKDGDLHGSPLDHSRCLKVSFRTWEMLEITALVLPVCV